MTESRLNAPPGGNQRPPWAPGAIFWSAPAGGAGSRKRSGGRSPKGGRVRCEGEAVARQGGTQFPRGLVSPALAGACFGVAAGRPLVALERGARSVEFEWVAWKSGGWFVDNLSTGVDVFLLKEKLDSVKRLFRAPNSLSAKGKMDLLRQRNHEKPSAEPRCSVNETTKMAFRQRNHEDACRH